MDMRALSPSSLHAAMRIARSPPSEFRVRLLYNEQVLPIPGCAMVGGSSESREGGPLDCELDVFLAATKAAAEQKFDVACQVGREGTAAALSGNTAPAG